MPLSTAAKAALCLCPPVAMAGTVATVPAVKRAVHHLTAPHHGPKPVRRIATAAAPPAREAAREADCLPVAGPLPAVPLVTYAAPIPDEPGAAGPIGGAPGGASPVQAPVAFGPVAAAVPTPGITPVPTSPVPEPASWALMILGAGAVGVALRRWQRERAAGRRPAGLAGGTLLSGVGTAAEAGDMAVTSVAAKSTLAGVAGKAMLCACPAAVVAVSAVGVPPVRHAVYAATAPAPVRPLAAAPFRSIVPCSQPMPVPVSATSVAGYPDTVTTLADRPA